MNKAGDLLDFYGCLLKGEMLNSLPVIVYYSRQSLQPTAFTFN
ncbi:MAG TPA: hypothetical protein QF695_06505 [Arenicellales bacterium]|nr:hypothetical protein [Pseudomonadales bacterium]MDP6314930.1 hypothetical protein [Pseudomonadales bacterium]MDP7314808.1 hypothetical protein [Pseudomonadales bacterium]HJL52274.1 hypothetical protein [Arenicellales bacterium]